MKTLSESPPLHAAAALRRRSVSFDLEICTADFLVLDSSQIGEARAGDVDDAYKSLRAETPMSCSAHGIAERRINEKDNDNDDDDLQWANVRLPLQRAPQSSGYGDGKGFYRASITTLGKENKVRFPRKLASSSTAIARQQHSGLLRPHSGPFSGPLTPLTMQSFGAKPNRAPSIIPATLLRRRVDGFNVCEPMSPEVTCLGRIRSKKLNNISVRDMMDGDVDSQAVEKGRCFDAKNQLCGKRSKGRKKKEKARRRFASAESKGTSLEHAQTRREKAATLARSLTDLLEDMRMRGLEKASVHYVPSVPPPNSLLLMRGCRIREDMNMDMDMGIEHGNEGNIDMGPHGEPSVPPPNSLLLMRGCKTRGNLSLPLELLMDRVPTKHVQASPPLNTNSDTHLVKKLKARTARHVSLLNLIDKEGSIAHEGVSTFQARDNDTMQGSNVIATDAEKSAVVDGMDKVNKFLEAKLAQKAHCRATLCQRRSFGELPFIEVKRRARPERDENASKP